MTTPQDVIARRRAERAELLRTARAYLEALDPALDLVAGVVVGSVARGDFHQASDIDVIVVARRLPGSQAQRWQVVAPRHGVVQPVAWTPEEWQVERGRRNPLVVDALAHGVWLLGSAEVL